MQNADHPSTELLEDTVSVFHVSNKGHVDDHNDRMGLSELRAPNDLGRFGCRSLLHGCKPRAFKASLAQTNPHMDLSRPGKWEGSVADLCSMRDDGVVISSVRRSSKARGECNVERRAGKWRGTGARRLSCWRGLPVPRAKPSTQLNPSDCWIEQSVCYVQGSLLQHNGISEP